MGKINIINKLTDECVVTMEGNEDSVNIIIDRKKDLCLCDIEYKPGTIIESLAGNEWILCDMKDGFYVMVRRKLLGKDMAFGETNNWENSDIRKYFYEEYVEELKIEFGGENIVPHKTDLLALDGYDDYGTAEDFVSLMSIDDYRKYHKYIGDCGRDYWLLTPHTILLGAGIGCVECVRGFGDVDYGVYCYARGVRPLIYLKSKTPIKGLSENKK